MDLLVIGSQETRNSSKRVRRNGEGKTDLLCSKWFWTRHCLLRTVLTFSHTSWSHYSKVFFVKGKGGKRGVANLFWATAKRREQRMTERRATKKSSTTEERATQDKASTRRRERHAAERTERGRHRHASTFFRRFSISWFFIFFRFSCCLSLFEILQKLKTHWSEEFLKFSVWASREIWKTGISKFWKREICNKIENLQNALILGLRKRQHAHFHVEILLKWKTEN